MSPSRSRLPILVVPALALAILGTVCSTLALRPPSRPALLAIGALLSVAYARMTLAAVASLLGLVPGRAPARVPSPGPGRASGARTALLVPVYGEAPGPIADAIAVMAAALRPSDRVEIFVLSDTRDPALFDAERAAFPPRGPRGTAVHYRRRAQNTGRKAGNIAEFCDNAGRAFDYAIVLDADSLMTGDAIRALIATIERDQTCALVQTTTYPVGGNTLFGRMQQFSARLNTPLTVAGQHLWQGRRGTFWGHNAIFRLDPFRTHARLPVLSGRPPMGGEILCHDTIEAALLLRAGWEVRLAPEIEGSYETTPGNLVDHLARERRWCQGNLQHLRLIGARGFVPESRLHVLIGILYYVSAPSSLALVVLLSFCGHADGPAPGGPVALCAGLTIPLLFAPRAASLLRAAARADRAERFGGRARLLASALLEQASTFLTGPIFTLSMTGFVFATAIGRVVRWDPQARGDRPVGWREAARRFGWHTAIGAGAASAALLLRPAALPWLAVLLAGPVLSIPLAVASGSVRLGALARRLGLFETEDERAPSRELALLSAGAGGGGREDGRTEPLLDLDGRRARRAGIG